MDWHLNSVYGETEAFAFGGRPSGGGIRSKLIDGLSDCFRRCSEVVLAAEFRAMPVSDVSAELLGVVSAGAVFPPRGCIPSSAGFNNRR